jgi:hypothetical protein
MALFFCFDFRRNQTLIFFLSDNSVCAEEITDSWRAWIIGGGEYVGKSKTLGGKLIQRR